jgi:LysM repeat protein
MQQRNIGSEILVALAVIVVLAFAITFAVVLSLTSSEQTATPPQAETTNATQITLDVTESTQETNVDPVSLTPVVVEVSATPTLTNTLTPTATSTLFETLISMPQDCFLYTVEANDSLESIGQVFGVSVEDIAEVNGITPTTRLRAGQTLIVPLQGCALLPTQQATATFTPAPTLTATSVPSNTFIPTATPTVPTATTAPSLTHTALPTSTVTNTSAPTATDTATPSATATQTSTDKPTELPSATPTVPSATPIPSATDTPTVTPLPPTATFTSTPTHTDVPTSTPTHTPTSTFTNTPSATPTATATFTPSPSATLTPTPTATYTPVRDIGFQPTPTSPLSGIQPTPTPSLTFAPTQTPSRELCPGAPRDWVMYTVEDDVTLFAIAQATGTTVVDLLRANCLSDADAVMSNAEIYVPRLPSDPIEAGMPSVTFTSEQACLDPDSAQLTTPAIGQEVSGVLTLIGTANASDFVYYRIDMRRPNAEAYEFLLDFDVPVIEGVLGQINTQAFEDGLYWLRLSVVTGRGSVPFTAICSVPFYIDN